MNTNASPLEYLTAFAITFAAGMVSAWLITGLRRVGGSTPVRRHNDSV